MRRTTLMLLIPVPLVVLIAITALIASPETRQKLLSDWIIWALLIFGLIHYLLFIAWQINSPHSRLTPGERVELRAQVTSLFSFVGRVLMFPINVYLRWRFYLSGLGEPSKLRFFVRRPWLFIVGTIKYVTGVALAQLRHRDIGQDGVSTKLNEIKLERDTCRWAAGFIWLVTVPILGAISTQRHPTGLWAVFLGVTCLVLLTNLALGGGLLLRSFAMERVIENFRKGVENERRLREHISLNRPFCLYLRDFGTESSPMESKDLAWLASSSTQGQVPMILPHREKVEQKLLGELTVEIDVFCFLNYYDFIDKPMAHRINAAEGDWKTLFTMVATHASLIVFLIEESIGEGTRFELDWLSEHQTAGELVIVTNQSGFDLLACSHPRVLKRARWKVVIPPGAAGDVTLPEDVRKYVTSSARVRVAP